MVSNWDKDLPGEMATFLTTVELVFKVNCSRTVLGEELGELDDG